MDLINQVITEKFINLEKLYIQSNTELKYASCLNFKRLVFKDCTYNFDGIHKETPLPHNIKDIVNLTINISNIYQNQIIDLFKHLQSVSFLNVLSSTKNSTYLYKSIYESTINDGFGFGDEDCYLSNLKGINDDNLHIEDIYYICKLSPNLSRINIGTCVDNLLYQIGPDEDGDLIIPCHCSTNSYNINSKQYLKYFVNYIKNSINLESILVKHKCGDYGSEMLNENISNKLMNFVLSAISSNKYLDNIEFKIKQ